MTFQHIETLQQAYTDKYVVVDVQRPELARFKDVVGQVRTVNMSGRALVEFLDYHVNTSWFDIDVDFLKVVDKPKPKEKPATKKAAAKKPAAKKPAADKPATDKPATEEVLTKESAPNKPEAQEAPANEKKPSPLEVARAMDAKKKEKPEAEGKRSTADIPAAPQDDQKPVVKAERVEEVPNTAAVEANPAPPSPSSE